MIEQIEEEKKEKPVKAKKPEKTDQKKKWLIIHNQEGAEGKQAVPVSVNGKMYNIPRNTRVEVPTSVIEALKNAEYTLYDDKGNPSNARRFMFEVSEIDEE